MKKTKKKTLADYQFSEKIAKRSREFKKNWQAEQISQTTLEQRRIFIETFRESYCFHSAMKAAKIDDLGVAYSVYKINSRPSKVRILVPADKVK